MVPTIVNMADVENANNLFLNKRFSLAVIEYEKILEKHPRDLTALNNMGLSLIHI